MAGNDVLLSVLEEYHANVTTGMAKLNETMTEVKVTVALNGQRLDGIIERQGVTNGRLNKAEDGIAAVTLAVHKDQWITEGAKQEAKDRSSTDRWVVGTLLSVAVVASGIVAVVLNNV